jgi:hypothetical protein
MRPVSRRRSGAPPGMGRASAQRGGTEHNLLGVMVAFAAWLMPSRGPPQWLV